jgi:hypothetical protein
MRRKEQVLVVIVCLAGALPIDLGAQQAQHRFQSEVRLDAIFARTGAVEGAYGFTVPAGLYVRSGLVAGIGAARHGVEGRSDFIFRFSFDPFRQHRWAPYAGAGASGRYRPKLDAGSRGYLLVFLGVEGPLPAGRAAGWVPAFELGLGGGTRVGVILRRGVDGRR